MPELRLSNTSLQYLTIFESVTSTMSKDCIEIDDVVVFIVDKGKLGLAIGRGSKKLYEMQRILQKRVKIVEFGPEKIFIKNLFKPYTVDGLEISDAQDGSSRTAIVIPKIEDKGRMIGKNGKNLNLIRRVVRRYYDINIVVQ